jgi:hypothetical protein
MNTSPYPPPARTVQPPVPPIPRASKGRVMRRGASRFFRGVGGGLRMLFSGRPILVACLVLLLPLLGWLMYDRMSASSSSGSSGPQNVVQLPEPPVIKQYLSAVQKGDTDTVWNTLSAGQKARRVANNEDKTVLARVLQTEQQSGKTYAATHYVGSYQEIGNGMGTLYFYVGDVGTGTQKRMVPLMFAVDKSGTIVEVDDGLYNAILAQLQSGP